MNFMGSTDLKAHIALSLVFSCIFVSLHFISFHVHVHFILCHLDSFGGETDYACGILFLHSAAV